MAITYETYTVPQGTEDESYFQDCPVDAAHLSNGDLAARLSPLDFPQVGTKNQAVDAPA